MFPNKKFISFLILSWQFAAAALAAEDIPGAAPSAALPTEVVLRECANCHGPNGVGVSPEVPHLDGQLHSYLIESIELLKTGIRPTKVANHIPATMAPGQIIELADHYSRSTGHRNGEMTDQGKVQQGRMIYSERCLHCHEENGRETDQRGLGSPYLAGQPLGYLREQILAYLSHERKYQIFMKENVFDGRAIVINGHTIRRSIGRLSRDDVEALAHFLASTPPRKAIGSRRHR